MPIQQHTIHISEPEKAPPQKVKRSHIAFGIALILLGLLFLIKQIGLIEITWPLILMVIGSAKLAEAWLFQGSDRRLYVNKSHWIYNCIHF